MLRERIIRGSCLSVIGALFMTTLYAADSRVADAAMQGDRAAVRALLKDGSDVNSAQGDGMTALHWAAMKDNVELAEMLLYAGANVKAITRLGGYTPLAMAARNGSASMIATLLKGGADAKAATSTGVTPLMMAAASGYADAVNVLLDHGADLDAKESAMEQTALMFAAASNRVDAMKALLQRGADVRNSTKVVDLYAFSREEDERRRRTQQRPPDEPASEPQGAREAPARPEAPRKPQIAGVDRQFLYNELVGYTGGLTPLLFAARQGHLEAVKTLLDAGANVNQVSAGDKTSPLLIATINGHFDLAQFLIEKGADPTLASENGVTPLYAALNVQWAPKALYPQPRAYLQQKLTYLDFMKVLLEKGVDPNARLKKKVWYSGYNFDLSGVDEIGATPFWRAAYASDVDAMRLLVAHGADPNLPTIKPAGRPRTGDGDRETTQDVSGKPPRPVGAPAVTPLQAAAGVGYGEGFAANAHRYAPGGQLLAVKYLVEELGADVNADDHEGNTALHHAAARGDVETILYLVSKGADVKAVNREGQTTADMANGPVQRTQPFPEALALLVKLGAKNNNKCVSC
jgi:ankyrin repeat protein